MIAEEEEEEEEEEVFDSAQIDWFNSSAIPDYLANQQLIIPIESISKAFHERPYQWLRSISKRRQIHK